MTTGRSETPVILGRYAGFFSRAAAFAIDQAIILGLAFAITVMVDYFINLIFGYRWLDDLNTWGMNGVVIATLLSSAGITLVISIFYNISFWMLSGQTPGKRVLGLRVVRADGQRLRLSNAIWRQVGYWLSMIFYLGFIWILFDNKRQGFHDKLSRTIVVYSWPEGRIRGTFVIERVQRFQDRRSKT